MIFRSRVAQMRARMRAMQPEGMPIEPHTWPLWARVAARMWGLYVRAGEAKEALLRRIHPRRMRIVPHSWPLWARMCPCDLHFCDFLQQRRVRSRSIFHLGTGGHHLVGLRNRIDDLGNVILGVTVSPDEIKRYVKLVVRDPSLGQNYKVLFTDVHDLQAASLPEFDLVTLFHLCESGSTTGSGHLLSDEEVLGLLTSKLRPGGLLALYRESIGYPRLRPIIVAAMAAGTLRHLEDYKSLEILEVPARTGPPTARGSK
jgi:hypothetical protein